MFVNRLTPKIGVIINGATVRKVIPLILCTAFAVFAQPVQPVTQPSAQPVVAQQEQQSVVLLQPRQWDCQCKLVPPPPPEKTEAEKRLEALNSKAMNVYKDARGTVLSMSDILFEAGKANLKQEAKDNLTEVAAILKTLLSGSHVEIEGHSDSLGNAANNEKLSQQRADAVLAHLVSRNVDSTLLKAKGYGSTRAIATNTTPEGRAKNRRVELVIEAEEIPELPEQTMQVTMPLAVPVVVVPVAQPVPQGQPVLQAQQVAQEQQVAPPQPADSSSSFASMLKKGGALARVNMNSLSTGNSKADDDYSMGMGFGVGYTISYPLSNFGISLPLSLNPEVLFYYRKLYNNNESDEDYEKDENLTEFAISIPVMVQYVPFADKPIHITAGLQFDIPFSSGIEVEITEDGESQSYSSDVKDRAGLDIGLALGAGYRLNETMMVDFRMVIGLSSLTGKSGDKSSLNQYGIGVTYWGF